MYSLFTIPTLTILGGDSLIAIENLLYLPVDIVVVYVTLYVLLPNFLFKKKYFSFALLIGLLIASLIVVSNLIDIYIINPLLYNNQPVFSFNGAGIIHSFAVLTMFVGVASTLKLLKLSYKNQLQLQKTNNEKLETELKLKETELKLLRSQLHPHFLFNTLNNLYSLANENSPKTKEIIIKISDLLSYILYEGNDQKVPLEKELDFINNYIELEKIRYGERLNLEIKTTKLSHYIEIAPLILFTFIDNAFKHGVCIDAKKPWVKIDIETEGKHIHFRIENSIPKQSKENISDNKQAGIGIKNTRRRLELIYPGKYNLQIVDNKRSFLVNLEIDT